MNDFFEWFVPCFVTLSIFLMIFGFAAFMRYMRYKETVALAERGLLRQKRGKNGQETLRWGIIILFLGIALCAGVYPIGFLAEAPPPFYLGPWILAGLLPMFFGLALIVIYALTQKETNSDAEDKS